MLIYRFQTSPPPLLDDIYSVTRDTTWSCAEKNHIWVFCETGCCYFQINTQTIMLEEGHAIFIPANTLYTRMSYENSLCKMFYIHFQAEHMELTNLNTFLQNQKFLQENHPYLYIPQTVNLQKNQAEVIKLLRQLRDTGINYIGSYRKLISSLLFLEFLVKFEDEYLKTLNVNKVSVENSFPEPLRKTVQYIQINYRQKITMEKLSKISGYTDQHLIRLFKKHLNTTPIKYINDTKCHHAISMLRNETLSIQEIAYELGFITPNYFSRLFKKLTGMTPLEKRIAILNYQEQNSDNLIINSKQ